MWWNSLLYSQIFIRGQNNFTLPFCLVWRSIALIALVPHSLQPTKQNGVDLILNKLVYYTPHSCFTFV